MSKRRTRLSERPVPPHGSDFAFGPPWMRGRARGERRSGCLLFLRIALTFGVIILLIAGWVGTLIFLATRGMNGMVHPGRIVWFVVGTLLLILPLMAMGAGRFAFRRFAVPLSQVMNAAEAVTNGDLTVRVPIYERRGEFNRLGETFNRMVTELERSDRHRRNMTADIAHELRTPLHVIQGNLEGILDGVYEPTSEHITATLSETRILARLVEDLRTLSLAEADQLPLARETVDINDLLADVVTGFSGQAENHNVTLHAELAATPQPLTIVGDAGRLDQVLSNLVANALRHTPPEGTITLRAEPRTGGVRLSVRDTGEGIPEPDLPYIFDRFWRGDAARSRTEGGRSGLGLAIVRQLIQAHGGQIEVASKVGAGTTFTIELPENGKRELGSD